METNMNPEAYIELRESGQILISSARAFWEVHQKLCGPRAVVWLEDDSGGLILFTRGEYKSQIMRNIAPLSQETPLSDPFIVDV